MRTIKYTFKINPNNFSGVAKGFKFSLSISNKDAVGMKVIKIKDDWCIATPIIVSRKTAVDEIIDRMIFISNQAIAEHSCPPSCVKRWQDLHDIIHDDHSKFMVRYDSDGQFYFEGAD